jgi:hypothetical protein
MPGDSDEAHTCQEGHGQPGSSELARRTPCLCTHPGLTEPLRCCPPTPPLRHRLLWPGAGAKGDPPERYGRDGTVERGTIAVARGLTALAAGVKKCADNNGGQANKRSHEATQGQAHKGTQEVEERSRWRWSPRRFGVHRNQDKFIPSQGPGRSAGPLSVHPSGADRAAPPLLASPLVTPSLPVSGDRSQGIHRRSHRHWPSRRAPFRDLIGMTGAGCHATAQ